MPYLWVRIMTKVVWQTCLPAEVGMFAGGTGQITQLDQFTGGVY